MGGLFGGGSTQSTNTVQTMSPAQENLLNLQAQGFSQQFPLQLAMNEAQAGLIGFRKRTPTRGRPVSWTPGAASSFLSPSGSIPAGATMPADWIQGNWQWSPQGWTWTGMGPEGMGPPPSAPPASSSAGDGTTTTAPLPVSPGTPTTSDMAPQSDGTWEYTGESPLISALQAAYTLRPEETALPGMLGSTAATAADQIRSAGQSYQSLLASLLAQTNQAGADVRTLTDNPLDTALLTALSRQDVDTSALRAAPWLATLTATQPLDSEGVLGPLRREYEQTIAPNIRSAAIQYGAPRGGGEQELQMRAGERYATAATQALAAQELQRRQQVLGASQLMTSAEASALQAQLQARGLSQEAAKALIQTELNRRAQAVQARETGIRSATLANLIGAQGYEAQVNQANLLRALALEGPKAQATLAEALRQNEAQRAMVPLSLLRGSTINIPGMPQYPTGSTSTQQTVPTLGAQIGAGLNTALMGALVTGPLGLGMWGAGGAAGAGLFGSLASAASPLTTALAGSSAAAASPLALGMAMGCWIGELLYGTGSPEVALLRRWLFGRRRTWWFSRLYLAVGERVAAWLRQHPWAQPPVRALFDWLLAQARHEMGSTAEAA